MEQQIENSVEFRGYSVKSKAVRALNGKQVDANDHELYLTQVDGQWGFYVDDNGTALKFVDARLQMEQPRTPEVPPEVDPTLTEEDKQLESDLIEAGAPADAFSPDLRTLSDAELQKEAETNPALRPQLGVFAALVQQRTAEPPAPTAAPKREPQATRPEANGVKRPSDNTLCGRIWHFLDQFSQPGLPCTVKRAKEEAERQGWDSTTIVVQFYRWRKFNGIKGRHDK